MMEVIKGGQLFMKTAAAHWYLWQNNAFVATADPGSPDGTTSSQPNGPALTTVDGTWTWGAAAAGRPGESWVNLNGTQTGIGFVMEVANGGKLYLNTKDKGWYIWTGTAFVLNGGPPPAPPPPPPPPAPPPPPGISPDGTKSAAPNGLALVTAAGTWTWGAAAVGRPGENQINLNGVYAPGIGSLMEVANGGKLYVETAAASWFVWTNTGFVPSGDPAAPPPTLTAIVLSPAKVTIPDNAPSGTFVASATVTTSDGSPFTGTLVLSGPDAAMFAVSGMNIVTARAFAPADDGMHTTTVTAHQGGQSISARFFI